MIVPAGLKLSKDGRTVPAWAVPLLGEKNHAMNAAWECWDMMEAFTAGAKVWKGWKFVKETPWQK